MKKNASILSYFSKKPNPSQSPATSPSIATVAKSPQLKQKGSPVKTPKGKGDGELNKSQEEIEADELARSCLEDDFGDEIEDVVEPKVEKKKRKRIVLEDSSDDENDESKDETFTPNKKTKLSERNTSLSSFSFSTPKSSTKKKEKENTSPPSSSNKLKNRLSAFASPSLNKSQTADDPSEDKKKDDEEKNPLEFPHTKYAFLNPAKIMDKNKRRPDDPDYDPGTLYIPDSFLRDQTPAQRQWWDFKVDHYGKVLFFKMGKFYELFHMDAVIAVERCGLIYMRAKEYAHCGFPEAAFERYAEVLVDLGYTVARIEQTETPADLDVRVKAMSRPTKFDKVVRREVCRITSLGTRMTSVKSDLNYLTAMCCQKSIEESEKFSIGLCFVDVSLGEVHMSQFDDDKELSCLETLLAFYPPVEIVCATKSRDHFSDFLGKFSFVNKRLMAFPDASKTLKCLHDYFGDKNEWPEDVRDNFLDDSDNLGLTPKKSAQLVLSAFGAIITYLSESMIDNQILMQKRIKIIDPPLDIKRKLQDDAYSPSNMIMDNKTLRNLDLIPDPEHPKNASLFSVVDKTLTPFGKRLLKQWLCLPLMKIPQILERQNIIKYFEDNLDVVQTLKNDLKGVPDLEKMTSSIHVSGIALPGDHPEQRAIYYEQASNASKKVKKLLLALETLEKLQFLFKEKLPKDDSVFAQTIVDQFPDITNELDFFKDAFNHKKAEETGKIIPKKGVDEDFDKAKKARSELEQDLDDYLRDQKKFFGSSDVKYFGSGNNMYQLEIPEQVANKKVNSKYTLSSQRKGFKRFTTEETRDFLARQTQVDEDEAEALSEVNRKIFHKFSQHKNLWEQIIGLTSMTDALLSLYSYGMSLGDECCLPRLQAPVNGQPYLKFVQGRHPIVVSANPDIAFIPNNFELDNQLAILTGANMGGKSTLMRTTALLTVLAQIGAKVPAEELILSPIDRIFTRIGASDNIFEKESTFFVELLETRIILKYATSQSLVLIDELGRGTSTFDGCAIAHAVAKFLTTKKCRTLFSTHYHELMREFVERNDMKVYHMGVMEDEEDVVFMYTVEPGPCSKSHGFNAAKMAGMPQDIIDQGLKIAEKFESAQINLQKLAEIIY